MAFQSAWHEEWFANTQVFKVIHSLSCHLEDMQNGTPSCQNTFAGRLVFLVVTVVVGGGILSK